MKLAWTRQALADLRDIRTFIAIERPRTAGVIARRIRARARTLMAQPFMGRIVDELDDPMIREVIESRYRIVYLVTETRVEILRVIDGARLLPDDQVRESSFSGASSFVIR